MLKTFEEAKNILLEASGRISRARILGSVEMPIIEACGRIAAEDYFCLEPIPSFGNSSMDGFAVLASETQSASRENPLRFSLLGSIAAGDPFPVDHSFSSNGSSANTPQISSSERRCWEIMTGAVFPEGFDAAVKVEDARVIRDQSGRPVKVEIYTPVQPGQNYRAPGTDFRVGAPLLRRGTRISPAEILGLAANSFTKIKVLKKPKVAIISTGKELVSDGSPLLSGQIRNSTSPYLLAHLSSLGAEPTYYGTAPDRAEDFLRMIDSVLRDKPDLIISTGAVSMGKHDFIPDALERLGAEMLFHKIKMRPGKPVLFAEFKDGLGFFGLPGNPVSTVVGMRFLVEPFLMAFMGRPQETPLRAVLGSDVFKPEGLRCFYKAQLHWKSGSDFLNGQIQSPEVTLSEGQDSYMVRPLLENHHWAVLPENTSHLERGSWIDVYPKF
jgi:molybdopterin molybdotransferase